ncbi:MAG: TetR/AcrR family transcriptional regulator [Terriglobales bacterium]|jgi:AcrR family transcriptional regulator
MSKSALESVSPARSPGRPRSEEARKAILQSTLALLKKVGFSDLSIESIAAHAGVGKATVYRWWPNKAALVIDAFVSVVEAELRYPSTGPAEKAFREQMERWIPIFNSPLGKVIAAVIGAGQSDPEIIEAFRAHWVEPRRREARELIRQSMKAGEIRSDIDPDTILDILYGPLYLRLMVHNGPLALELVDKIFAVVLPGLKPQ